MSIIMKFDSKSPHDFSHGNNIFLHVKRSLSLYTQRDWKNVLFNLEHDYIDYVSITACILVASFCSQNALVLPNYN